MEKYCLLLMMISEMLLANASFFDATDDVIGQMPSLFFKRSDIPGITVGQSEACQSYEALFLQMCADEKAQQHENEHSSKKNRLEYLLSALLYWGYNWGMKQYYNYFNINWRTKLHLKVLEAKLNNIEEVIKKEKIILIINSGLHDTLLYDYSSRRERYVDPWFESQSIVTPEDLELFRQECLNLFADFVQKNKDRVFIVYNTGIDYGAEGLSILPHNHDLEPVISVPITPFRYDHSLAEPFAIAASDGVRVLLYDKEDGSFSKSKEYSEIVRRWMNEDKSNKDRLNKRLALLGIWPGLDLSETTIPYNIRNQSIAIDQESVNIHSESEMYTYSYFYYVQASPFEKNLGKYFLQDIHLNKGSAMRYIYQLINQAVENSGVEYKEKWFFVLGNSLNDVTMLRPDVEAGAFGLVSIGAKRKRDSRHQQAGLASLEDMSAIWKASIMPKRIDDAISRCEWIKQHILEHRKVFKAEVPGVYGLLLELHDRITDKRPLNEHELLLPCRII